MVVEKCSNEVVEPVKDGDASLVVVLSPAEYLCEATHSPLGSAE